MKTGKSTLHANSLAMRRLASIRSGLAVMLLAGAFRESAAQELRGTVRDSASRQPIRGAVLLLLDSSTTVLGRNLSNERGEYRIALPNNARRVRVVRIGFRPRELSIPARVAGVAHLDVGMVSLPTMLEPVRVTAGARCPNRSDRDAAFALLEQARAGLLATIVAREANPPALVRLSIERFMEGTSDRIAHQKVRIDSTVNPTSFNAAHTATDFVRRGFAEDSAGTEIFFGPDAEVLLDEGFADGYCFRLADRDRARANQTGLAFAAADRRRGRVDLEGTLWIDTVARALRDIDYHYVGLDRQIEAFHPGGQTFFREMANGVVLIDRWNIRLVGATLDTVRTGKGESERPRYHLAEQGGEVARASWPDGYTWRASLGTLRVHMIRRDRTPVAGAIMRLADTDYQATTDSSGTFEISDLAPGPYAVTVLDPHLAPQLAPLRLDIPTNFTFVAARDSTIERTLEAPTVEDLIISRCVVHHQQIAGALMLILGRAMTSGGEPVKDVTITVFRRATPTKWIPLPVIYKTGSDGVFEICARDLEPDMIVSIRARHDKFAPLDIERRLDDHVTIVPLELTSSAKP